MFILSGSGCQISIRPGTCGGKTVIEWQLLPKRSQRAQTQIKGKLTSFLQGREKPVSAIKWIATALE
jgi:hypothetical protein